MTTAGLRLRAPAAPPALCERCEEAMHEPRTFVWDLLTLVLCGSCFRHCRRRGGLWRDAPQVGI